jgi:uncharacterized membrane protein YfhO
MIHEGDGRPLAAIQSNNAPEPLVRLVNTVGPRTVTPATSYKISTNKTSFEVKATGPGVIVLNETFEEDDFHAQLDGQQVPYLRVNHVFKGIYVDQPGLHRVSFEYWPKRFTFSLWLAALGLALAVGAIVYTLRQVRT